MKEKRPIRILLAKPGLDGHDVGAKVIARALMGAGFEVIYTGLRKTPEQIVNIAADEDVQVIGLSILSGSHIPICRRIEALRREADLDKTLWVVGGSIPRRDHDALRRMGVDAVFATGSATASVVGFLRERTA